MKESITKNYLERNSINEGYIGTHLGATLGLGAGILASIATGGTGIPVLAAILGGTFLSGYAGHKIQEKFRRIAQVEVAGCEKIEDREKQFDCIYKGFLRIRKSLEKMRHTECGSIVNIHQKSSCVGTFDTGILRIDKILENIERRRQKGYATYESVNPIKKNNQKPLQELFGAGTELLIFSLPVMAYIMHDVNAEYDFKDLHRTLECSDKNPGHDRAVCVYEKLLKVWKVARSELSRCKDDFCYQQAKITLDGIEANIYSLRKKIAKGYFRQRNW